MTYILSQDSREDDNKAATTPYDCVNAPDWWAFCFADITNFPQLNKLNSTNRIAPHGQSAWAYGELANQLIDYYGYVVPHAFFNTAEISTTVQEWSDGANGTTPSSTHIDGGDACEDTFSDLSGDVAYYPYRSLRNTLRYFGNMYGVKAVLWHQGEFDNYTSGGTTHKTSQSDYKNYLNNVISKSRTHFNSNLNWVVAKVSYFPASTPTTRFDVTNAQTTTYSSGNGVLDTYVFAGPNSDALINTYSSPTRYDRNNSGNGVHFSDYGCEKLGQAWYNAIKTTSFAPIAAASIPTISITKSGSGYVLTAPSGYSKYRWVYGDSNSSSYFSTLQSVTISAFTEVRCYLQSSNGKWLLSQRYLALPSGCQGYRASNTTSLVIPSLEIYPNPIEEYQYIEFKVESESNVRIELLDENGKKVKLIVEAMHGAGKFKYAINLNEIKDGVYYYKASIGGYNISKRFIKGIK